MKGATFEGGIFHEGIHIVARGQIFHSCCLQLFFNGRTITDSWPQSLLCAAVNAFTSALPHSAEPWLWLQEISRKVKDSLVITGSLCFWYNTIFSNTFIFSLPSVETVQGGSAARSRWSLALRHRDLDLSLGEAVPRMCWTVKHQTSCKENGSEREPSPGDPASSRTKRSQSAAESGSLVRDTTLNKHENHI